MENGIQHSTGIKLARNTRNEYCMLHFFLPTATNCTHFCLLILLDFSLTVKAATLIFLSEGVVRGGGAGVRGWRVRNRGWRVRNRGWRGREAGVEGAGSGDRGGGKSGKIGAGN